MALAKKTSVDMQTPGDMRTPKADAWRTARDTVTQPLLSSLQTSK